MNCIVKNVDGFTDMIDIGSTFQDNFDIEKLIESDVDVAILGEYQYNALTDKVETLEEAGIPVVVITIQQEQKKSMLHLRKFWARYSR